MGRVTPRVWGSRARAETLGLDRELGNLRAAVVWFACNDDGERFLRMVVSLSYYWVSVGHWSEAIGWLEIALATNPEPSHARARALESLGIALSIRNDVAGAESALQEALALSRQLELATETANVLSGLGRLRVDHGQYRGAENLFTEAISIAHSANDADMEAMAWVQAGLAAWGRGDYLEAMTRFERGLAIWETVGWSYPVGIPARHMAMMTLERGEVAKAADIYRRYLVNAPEAVSILARSLPDVASMIARIDPASAGRLFGAGAELAEALGLVVGLPHKRVHERALAEVRQALGAGSFDAEFENGRQLHREQLGAMVTAALDAAARSRANGRPIDGSPNGHGLTPRERDVLRLLEMRMTDHEIAERLFVSRKTASKHVSAILAKLGVSDRRAAAAEAMRQGLNGAAILDAE